MDNMPLRNEHQMYNQLQSLQGICIPVCLGIIDLIKPYYYNTGAYGHFMLMSYGGRPILKELPEPKPDVVEKVIAALERLHQHQVLHGDAEPRNVLYDKRTGGCLIVDLMLAELQIRQPLGPISVNGRNRKRSWAPGKFAKDVFTIEAQSLRASLTRRARALIFVDSMRR